MRAFEVGANSADFDQDSDADGFDFLSWQRGFGTLAPNANKTDGDANNVTAVDGADLTLWQGQFGQSVRTLSE